MTGRPRFNPPIDDLHRETQLASARAAELRRRLRAGLDPSAASIGDAEIESVLAELDLALEELHTAEEELRQQQDELLEAHRRLELERLRYLELFEQAPAAYIVTDPHGKILAANRAASALLGVSTRHLVGKPIQVFVPPAERGDFRDLLLRLRADERVGAYPMHITPRHDQERPVDVTAAAVRDLDGRLEAIRWVLHDTAAQERMRAEHYRTTELFGTLIGAAPFPIIAFDGEARVTTWNPAAERVFGWTRSEVLGRPIPFLDENADGEGACAFRNLPVPQLSRFGRAQLDCRTRDGRTIRVGVTTARLRELTGAERGGLAVFSLGEEASGATRRSAETAEVVQLLAGGVAHNFNNLLTVILAHADLAVGGLPPEVGGAHEHLVAVRSAATRASEIANQLLGFAERLGAEARPVMVNPLAERAAEMILPTLAPDVRLVSRLDPACGETRADPALLERMLAHLLRNAVEATGATGTIALETRPVVLGARDVRQGVGTGEPGPYILIRVRDTGPGMTPDARVRIFDPFYTTKAPGQGLGLGLAMVRGVVSQVGGLIRVESQLGRGTTVDVYLPAIPPDSPET